MRSKHPEYRQTEMNIVDKMVENTQITADEG
jgi:hypothetical protein